MTAPRCPTCGQRLVWDPQPEGMRERWRCLNGSCSEGIVTSSETLNERTFTSEKHENNSRILEPEGL